tara:strand:+ start:386 stop:607 length:222 start_codon:yes stop_codon:yes gene_type:complete
MDKYKRLKQGEANFVLVERFDDVEKAANPSTEGEFVEIKINDLKINFTKVTKEQDGKNKKSSAETDGQTKKEK